MAQHCAHTIRRFNVRGKAFVPPPKVDAGLVTLVPLPKPLIDVDVAHLELVLRQIFGQRRKMLRNAAQTLDNGLEILALAQVDETRRPDQLTIKEWGRLANAYGEVQKRTQGVSKKD